MATKTCKWWRSHRWGPSFSAPAVAGLADRDTMASRLELNACYAKHNLDAYAAFMEGASIQICTVCGGARRAT